MQEPAMHMQPVPFTQMKIQHKRYGAFYRVFTQNAQRLRASGMKAVQPEGRARGD